MESKTFKQIEGRKKKKINGLFVLSFFFVSSLISFSLIGCDGGGGGGGGGFLPSSGTIGANEAPVADFSATPDTGIAPLLVNFDASGSNDPDGVITLYEWDFEDDGVFDEAGPNLYTVTHMYDTPGQKTALLRVTDDKGGVDVLKKDITVFPNQPPVAYFTVAPNLGIAPVAANFDASGSNDPDGVITLYEWDFEDDGVFDEAGPNLYTVTHMYDTPGQKTTCLKVTDDKGGFNESRREIVVFSSWEMTNGPCSGSIPSLAIDPADSEIVYSITRKNQVYKSADGGISWNSFPTLDSKTQENIWAQQLEVAPTDNQVLYLGTVSQGMYKSTDGGETWGHISNGLPETQYGYLDVDHILIDPDDSNIVYIRLDMGYRIYKTVDGGQNWFEIYDGTAPPYNPANDMVIDPTTTIDPATTRVLYIGLWYAGVWKSTDGGLNWTPKNNGLPQDLGGNISIFELAIDHQEPFRVYAGTFDYGVYRTENGGDSWGYLEIFPGPDYQEILSLEVDPNDQFTIYIGVNDRDDSSKDGLWVTTDGGWNWTQYFPFTWVWFIRIAPSNSTVFVDADKWYKRSAPTGDWQQVQFDGIVDVRVNVLSQNLPFNSSMCAGTECGVYQTTDSGSNWTEINNELTELVSPLYIYALAVDPNNFQKVYVGTYDDGVFLTTDGGEVWEERNTGLSDKYLQALAIYPADSDVAYVGTRGGIFKTEDGGQSWVGKNTGLTDLWIKCLVIDPMSDLDNLILYVGTGYEGESGKIFKTTNGGEMWVDVSNGLPDNPVRSLAMFPFDNQIVYAAFNGEGIYLSKDGGENWVQKNNGLTSTNVISLAISQMNDEMVFAGTEDEGVFATIDGGDNWIKIDGGLSCTLNRRVNSITIAPNDEIVYAGTGCGVFKAYK